VVSRGHYIHAALANLVEVRGSNSGAACRVLAVGYDKVNGKLPAQLGQLYRQYPPARPADYVAYDKYLQGEFLLWK
jgi:hypothetical protein